MSLRAAAVLAGVALLALLGAGTAAGQITIPTITTTTTITLPTTTTTTTTTSSTTTTTTTASSTTTTASSTTTTTEATTTTGSTTSTTTDTTTTTASSTTTTASSTTTTTTTTPAGALTISVPSAAQASGTSGGTITVQLGVVTVNGGGTVVPRTWLVTVSASDFVSDGGAIPAADVSYASGPATADTTSVAVPGQATTALAVPLSTPAVAFSGTFGINPGSVSWNPSLLIAPPANAPRGDYTGTITHSVA